MNKRLIIINVVEYPFFDLPGGAARLAHDLCCQQVKWGYQVFLIGKKLNPDLPDFETRDGINVIRCAETNYRSPDPRNLIKHIINARNAVKNIILDFGNVDVIHSHTPMQGLGALTAVSGSSTLRIYSIHSPWLLEMQAGKNWEKNSNLGQYIKSKAAFKVAKYIEESCLSRSDFITSDSEFTKKEIFKNYARTIKNNYFDVFPGWVDVNRFSPIGPRANWESELGHTAKGPVFFSLRRLEPRYGLEMLIEAAALVKKKKLIFELIIGGDGPLKVKLQKQIQKLSLEDRVILLGRVEDSRLPILYRSSDVFVLPTLALECFGIIILEALASGKPVIATPVGAIPEIMAQIFPEGILHEISSRALSEAMIRYIKLIKSGGLTKDQANRFRQHVCEHYSIESGTSRFKELYETSSI